jgi:hypothetical protein
MAAGKQDIECSKPGQIVLTPEKKIGDIKKKIISKGRGLSLTE